MSEWWGHFAGVIILVLMAVFIGIWIWAWRARHKRVFDRMSRLPMEDERNTEVPRADGGAEDNEDDRR
ncbi:MAG: cbb3-type cytochrome c oxidase subunit 3 [Pseudomonadota bacterium]|nr:cbb3-type cytochrome c oxidase subunit 3 [Pseudomonadota bacterium]